MAASHSATLVAGDQTTTTTVVIVDAIHDDAAQGPSSSGVEEEELKRAAEKVTIESSKFEAKVHKYPAIFRDLMSKYGHYLVPCCVAIGPYHHGAPNVRRAEEMKRAAAYFTCTESGHPAEEVYAKILAVAGDARSCYDHDAVAGIPQADFATMMFLDGCFLLQYILWRTTLTRTQKCLSDWFMANIESIPRDIFMLENQVPWLVLDALMAFMPAQHVDVGMFISCEAISFEARLDLGIMSTGPPFVLNESYKPAHLLDLLWYYQSGSSVPATESSRPAAHFLTSGITSLQLSSSAIDLAEIGIHLTQNNTAKFKDVGVEKGCCFYKLVMAPMVMDDLNACWLLNMLAFEASSANCKGTTVSTFVQLFAMLMNREEDVHELRVKGMLHGSFSDQHTLSFFEDLTELTGLTMEYINVLARVEAYRRNRWMWISLHRFVYNNMKYIVTVLSIIGVLVGIFKALFSIKQS